MFRWVATDGVTSQDSTATYSTLVLRRKKLLGHVIITNDMLTQDLYGIASLIQNDMLRNLALTEDRGFIYGDGADGEPVGINNITGISSDARTSTPDTAKIRKDLLRAKNHLNSNDLMDDGSRVWIMTPSVRGAIEGRETTTGDLANYARELSERGTLLGYRVVETTSQETGVITLVQSSQLIIGNGTILELQRDDSVKFLDDSIAIRGKHSSDINVSHAKAIAKITSVTDWE
jgi:HK97 family phage major capsid protein